MWALCFPSATPFDSHAHLEKHRLTGSAVLEANACRAPSSVDTPKSSPSANVRSGASAQHEDKIKPLFELQIS